jgi:hypothetical protein
MKKEKVPASMDNSGPTTPDRSRGVLNADVVVASVSPATMAIPQIPESIIFQEILQYISNKPNGVELSWMDQYTLDTTTKGCTPRHIISQLIERGEMEKLKDDSIKLYDLGVVAGIPSKSIGYYWCLMELIELVMTDEQRTILAMSSEEIGAVPQHSKLVRVLAYRIEKAAFEKMAHLDTQVAAQNKPTLTGLGGRYQKYCVKNNIHRKKISKNTASCDVDEPKQSTLGSFFALLSPKKKKKTTH